MLFGAGVEFRNDILTGGLVEWDDLHVMRKGGSLVLSTGLGV